MIGRKQVPSYTDSMGIRGYETKDTDGSDLILIGITEESVTRFKKLQKAVDAKNPQDLIRLALVLLEKVAKVDKEEKNGKKAAK